MRHLFFLFGLLVVLLNGASGWAAILESPARRANVSGLGFISGWKCDAGDITVRIDDGGPIPVATGMPRGDIRHSCGTINHGFITQINWALLGDGEHTITAYDDGVKFASATFTVTTFGEEFVQGARGECTIDDFPAPGETAHFAWNESTQHLELTHQAEPGPEPEPPVQPGLAALLGTWDFTLRFSGSDPLTHLYLFDQVLDTDGPPGVLGRDPIDGSTFIVGHVADLGISGFEAYTYIFTDLDDLGQGVYGCLSYLMNQTGPNQLSGAAFLAPASQPTLDGCDFSEEVEGTFTARRR